MFDMCEIIYQLSQTMMIVDINNISLAADMTKIIPDLLGMGKRISCANLSKQMNKNKNWEQSNFHEQIRQTNLNLWFRCNEGRFYASVYPRGSIRITSKNANIAKHMLASITENIRMLGIHAVCDDINVVDTTPKKTRGPSKKSFTCKQDESYEPPTSTTHNVPTITATLTSTNAFHHVGPVCVLSNMECIQKGNVRSVRKTKFNGMYKDESDGSETESDDDSNYDKIYNMFMKNENELGEGQITGRETCRA